MDSQNSRMSNLKYSLASFWSGQNDFLFLFVTIFAQMCLSIWTGLLGSTKYSKVGSPEATVGEVRPIWLYAPNLGYIPRGLQNTYSTFDQWPLNIQAFSCLL